MRKDIEKYYNFRMNFLFILLKEKSSRNNSKNTPLLFYI